MNARPCVGPAVGTVEWMEHLGARRRHRRPAATFAAAITVAAVATACTSSKEPGAPPPGSTGTTSTSGSASGGTTSSAASTGMAPAQASMGTPRVLASGLEVPWGLAFLADGSALVSERISHRIVRVSPTGTITAVGSVAGVAGNAGEGGLLGLALSPAFATDHLLYAYLTAEADNRVVRMTYVNGALGTPQVVFTGIPKASNHDGGRIAFGPDGLLYVTAGDANQRNRAPDRSYLGGKVLRMTPTGQPAPGNPFPDSVVYTVGHRNPQGLAWGPDGSLYEAEFGQDTFDEINLLRPGQDYGWPTDEGTTGPDRSGLTRPLLTWSTDDASPSGLAYAGGSLWLATLKGQRVYRIPVLAGGKVGSPQALFEGDYGRLRTIARAPDGALWLTTSNRDGRGDAGSSDDRIIRIPLSA